MNETTPGSAASPSYTRRRELFFAFLFFFLVLNLNWIEPVLRLSKPFPNALFLLLGQLSPSLAFLQNLVWPPFRRRWVRVLVGLALVPVLMFSLFSVLLVGLHSMTLLTEEDHLLELVEELPRDGYVVRIYRTNFGATTSFGVEVRQERKLVPGLLLVRRLHVFYPCYRVDAEFKAKDDIYIQPHAYEGRESDLTPREFQLRQWVYID